MSYILHHLMQAEFPAETRHRLGYSETRRQWGGAASNTPYHATHVNFAIALNSLMDLIACYYGLVWSGLVWSLPWTLREHTMLRSSITTDLASR
jgi:hypothetical protein